MVDTAEQYDLSGREMLNSKANVFLSRYDSLVTRALYLYLDTQIPKPAHTEATFLDLCCGTGIHSVWAAKLGYHVEGIDLSPKSIEAARWLASVNDVSDRCQFVISEAEEFLVCTDRSYDVIFISGALYYLNAEKIGRLVRERLRPGGLFVAMETNGDNLLMNAYRNVKNYLASYRDSRTMNNLLRRKDFKRVCSLFERTSLRYFDFMTLPIVAVGSDDRLLRNLHGLVARLDQWLLNVLRLHRFAFKVVITAYGDEPRKPSAN